jgi:metal-responsive CopG/Arc/MetJ family transcriptional regulator
MLIIGKRITITLAPNIYKSLEKHTKKKGITKSALISIALEKYVKEEESRDK